MKTLLTFVAASLFAVSAFAQPIPGLMPAPAATGAAGTDLGANTTSGAAGIDLANRVKLRGYVDFVYDNLQNENGADDAGFNAAVDLDFLLDFSPVTAEIHTNLTSDRVGTATPVGGGAVSHNTSSTAAAIEQAFIRYNVNRDFSISMGRQLSVLGFEADEAPNLYQVSNAYLFGDILGAGNHRRNYADGIRANFNNARFGFTLGLHNSLYNQDNATKSGDLAVDLQAAVMIMPGLEGRLGYAHESTPGDEIEQINIWLSYAQGGFTGAIEYDDWEWLGNDSWNIMLLGSYQFNPLFALTLRYSNEDEDTRESDRITLGLGFTITDNFGLNLELSHAGVDTAGGDYDVDEFYAESIMTF